MEYRSPVCRARICRKSPLIFQHPSFILARRNNRHHFRVSSRMMPMPPGYTKVFGFAPTWCTKECVARNCSAFFIAIFQRRFNLVHHRVTRTARARRRSGGQKRPSGAFLERGRVPDGAPEKAPCCKAGRFSYVDLYWENRHLVSGLPFLVYTSEYSISGLRMCLQNGGSAVS